MISVLRVAPPRHHDALMSDDLRDIIWQVDFSLLFPVLHYDTTVYLEGRFLYVCTEYRVITGPYKTKVPSPN
jgi:hypothetical protein